MKISLFFNQCRLALHWPGFLAKKILHGLFVSGVIFLSSCTQRNERSSFIQWMEPNGKIKVLATIAQIGDLVAAVGNERVDCLVLISKDLDPHSYELVKGDIEKFTRADLIFCNGLGLEHGVSLASQLAVAHDKVSLGEFLLCREKQEILYQDRKPDPHVWMDVSLWAKTIPCIVRGLSEQDPEGAEYYQRNGAQLLETMKAVDTLLQKTLHTVPEKRRYLVTSHDAFEYFTRRYLAEPGEKDWGLRFSSPEGLSPDGQLSPMDLKETLNFLKEHEIHVVFPESNVNTDSIVKIAKAASLCGMNVRVCAEPLYGDSTGGLGYLEMMEHNAKVIAENL